MYFNNMWALVNPDDGNIMDIVDTATNKYDSIYKHNFPNISWIEWSAAADDFNKEKIAEWCYDSKTSRFIKKIAIVPDINDSLEMNKITAKILLAKTDWAVLEDVNLLINRQDFIDYRKIIRDCIINPREGCITWPEPIEAQWHLPMIINISTMPGNFTIELPFDGISSLNVYWGDGSSSLNTKVAPTHTYSALGKYKIEIGGAASRYGKIPSGQPNIGASLISSVSQWGLLGFSSLYGAFFNASNLLEVPTNIPSSVTDVTAMFYAATRFNQDISNWNMSNVTRMNSMFAESITFNKSLNNWNTSSVIDMTNMFYSASSFNQNISNWSTSNVKNMAQMFMNASSFDQDISTWNVSSVIFMRNMFDGASNFNKPLNNWSTSNVTDMENMFNGARSFNQDISTWNILNVTNMNSMFNGATSFNTSLATWSIDLSKTSNVDMFNNCPLSISNQPTILTIINSGM